PCSRAYAGGMDHNTTDTGSFTLTSAATPEGSVVAAQQLVDDLGGENLSPDLSWSGARAGTGSFAVPSFGPAAPTGAGFWRWAAWDIPGASTSLPLGVARDRAGLKQAINDFGWVGYDGPNPPEGPSHRYVFTVHALPVVSLEADPQAPHVGTRFAIFTQQLASAS